MEQRAGRISEQTLVPLGFAAVVITALLGGTWWMSALYARVATTEKQISSLEQANREMLTELREVNNTLIRIRVTLEDKKK